MRHIGTPDPDSLYHFASVPEPDSLCDTCKRATKEDVYNIELRDLEISAESGCQECRLRHLGVLRALEGYNANAHVTVLFRGPLTHISRTYQGRLNGNLSVYFCTDINQPKSLWPIAGPGRTVGPRETTYLGILQEWLRICNENHLECRKNEDVVLPTRVLDVAVSSTNRIRLRELPNSTGCYLALSHCWGGNIPTRTTRENVEDYKDGIDFEGLPRKFQDAVMVTKGLGLRYLWIDALCIVQDDKKDWETESAKMASVYRNAYVVVGADMTHDTNGGFLKRKKGGFRRDETPIAIVDSENTTIFARSQEYLHDNPCTVFNKVQPVEGPLTEPLLDRA